MERDQEMRRDQRERVRERERNEERRRDQRERVIEREKDEERRKEWSERWREIKRGGEIAEKELESESKANRTRNPAMCVQTRSKMELIRKVLPCSFTQ